MRKLMMATAVLMAVSQAHSSNFVTADDEPEISYRAGGRDVVGTIEMLDVSPDDLAKSLNDIYQTEEFKGYRISNKNINDSPGLLNKISDHRILLGCHSSLLTYYSNFQKIGK